MGKVAGAYLIAMRGCTVRRVPRIVVDRRVSTGGVGRYAENLVRGMRAAESHVDLIEIGPSQPGVAGILKAPFTPWGRAEVARFVRHQRADLFHGLHLELPDVAIPSVVTIHDVIPLLHPPSMPNPFKRAVFKRLIDSAMRKASRVIVPSPPVARSLLELGADTSIVRVIPMAVSEVFSPLSEQERSEARDMFAGGRRYLACVSGPKSHKNLLVLAAIAGSLQETHDIAFECRGTPPSSSSHRGALNFIPHLVDAQMRLFYGGAEVFVLPSSIEGFGLPAVEAAACGTAVICSSRIGASAYLGEAALMVGEPDERSLTTALHDLLDDEQKRLLMGSHAGAISARLSVASMTEATLEVYEEALGASLR